MTTSSPKRPSPLSKLAWLRTPAVALLLIPLLYATTLARGLVLGDPTEYTFVAHVLGIAHPPGYAFITLLGKAFQTLIPFGDIPFRMHLLAATSSFVAALAVCGMIHQLARAVPQEPVAVPPVFLARLAHWLQQPLAYAAFGGLLVAFQVNQWQHAIHTNPHIITATFFAVNLYLLTRWGVAQARGEGGERPLLLFAFLAGLGIPHHPLTAFAFPAYTVFILLVRPRILRDWRLLLKMVGTALLGLALFAYYPIRSGMNPPVGPNTMNTWDGFLDHVLARGLTESLPFYTLVEQPLRAVVFWSILRLQYALPMIFLALLGSAWLLAPSRFLGIAEPPLRRLLPRLGGLYLLTFGSLYAFVISLKQQDIMAYLLGPLLIVGLLAGIGLWGLIRAFNRRLVPRGRLSVLAGLLVAALVLLGPGLQIGRNLPRISLSSYAEGDAYVAAVFSDFAGEGEGVVLLNNWEFMTPLWYTQLVEERWPDPADVRPEFVSAAVPWLPSVFNYLGGSPVYLNGYRQEIVNAGFRLRPRERYYQVVEPGDSTVPEELTRVEASSGDGGFEIIGYELPDEPVNAGDFVPFKLAMRLPLTTTEFLVPLVEVGDLQFPFTTDSHLTTPNWLAGEVIVERFDFALPHDLPSGQYPISVRVQNLSQNADSGLVLELPPLVVTAERFPRSYDYLLANFRQRVGLLEATVWDGLTRRSAPWPAEEALEVAAGDVVNIFLDWEALDYAEESYTIFVHLIDPNNRPLLFLDYTPLGGAVPTHLWIPKWLPGQTLIDPYRLEIPAELPPGTYFIEVGIYEMTSGQRLHRHDAMGNLVEDRYILGALEVR